MILARTSGGVSLSRAASSVRHSRPLPRRFPALHRAAARRGYLEWIDIDDEWSWGDW
jgi:hypothetical protein